MYVVAQDELPLSAFSRELIGDDHGGVGVSLILVEAAPGRGPSLHEHPYEELFIVQEGEATFFTADEERVVRAGEIVIVPGGTPHGFTNTGDGPLRQIDVHVNSRFVTEWLER
jgi:quercetin dioxygenase-like cupin family protein